MMRDDVLSDHDWQAYRYVTGEMADAEVEAYEALLAGDLESQQALSDVVRLTALMSVGAEQVVSGVVRTRQRTGRVGRLPIAGRQTSLATVVLVLSALAGMAWMLTLPMLSVDPTAGVGGWESSADSRLSESLLELWAVLDDVREPDEEAGGEDSVASSDLVIPDWMLAAVEAETLEGESSPLDHRPAPPLPESHDRL